MPPPNTMDGSPYQGCFIPSSPSCVTLWFLFVGHRSYFHNFESSVLDYTFGGMFAIKIPVVVCNLFGGSAGILKGGVSTINLCLTCTANHLAVAYPLGDHTLVCNMAELFKLCSLVRRSDTIGPHFS